MRPTYHWSLNKLIKDRIPGSPGPAIRTHGEMTAIRGGLHLNGHNAWLGAGDFSGGCISGMQHYSLVITVSRKKAIVLERQPFSHVQHKTTKLLCQTDHHSSNFRHPRHKSSSKTFTYN